MTTIKINGESGTSVVINGTSGQSFKVNPSFSPASFSPASLDGLKAWYDASALTLSNEESITTWADKSGFGNTLTYKHLNGYRLDIKYIASDSLLNNRPVAEFPGTSGMDLDYTVANTIPSGHSFSFYTVGYALADGGLSYAYLGGGDSGTMLGFIAVAGNRTKVNNNGSNAASKTILPNTPSIFSYGYAAGTTIASNLFYFNGSNAGVTQHPGGAFGGEGGGYYGDTNLNGMYGGIRIGGSYHSDKFPFNGRIAEVLLYDGKHTSEDRDAVTAYLATKYGISI